MLEAQTFCHLEQKLLLSIKGLLYGLRSISKEVPIVSSHVTESAGNCG